MKYDPEAWSFSRPCLGGLNTAFILPAKAAPRYLVTLMHGFGAPGTDLVNLFDDLLYYMPDNTAPFGFLCPEGPIDLEEQGIPDGRAWWPLNMAQLMMMSATNSFDAMRETVPPELDGAREQLQTCIDEARKSIASDFQLEDTLPVVLGGFSQGAMLATDTALRGSLKNVAGLIAYSGALICESHWRRTSNPVRNLPLIQSHGRLDNILPFATGQWLYELLSELGFDGKLLEFDGPHTIPSEAILQTAKMLHTIGA